MRRITYIIFLIFLSGAFVYGQQITVRPGGKELIESEPNQALTTVFRVTNETDEPVELVSGVDMPEGWKLITPEFPYTLQGQSSDIRILSIYIPRSTMVGTYPVTYRVHGREFPSLSDQYTIDIAVLPVIYLDVQTLDEPLFAIAGEPYIVVFRVANFSNMTKTIHLKIESRSDYRLPPSDKTFLLDPSESRDVSVEIDTDPKKLVSFKQYVQCSIHTEDKKGVSSIATSGVEILPRIRDTGDRYHQLPIQVALRHVWQLDGRSNTGLQGELYSQGTLDEAGTKRISFRLRGPDIYETSYMAEHDEYTMSFSTDRYEIHAGDRNYTLSPLTQQYRYGRGIESRYRMDQFRFGAYFHKTRWIIPASNQVAAFIKYDVKDDIGLGLNYLRKKFEGEAWSDIYSVETWFQPFQGTDVELEYAGSTQNGSNATAFRAKLRGNQSWLHYNVHLIRANRDFKGYYRDTNLSSFSISVEPLKRFRINAGYRQQQQNFDADTTQFISPLSKYAYLGAHFRVSKRTHLTVDWICQNREDRMPVPKFKYGENTIRFGLSHTVRMFNLYASGEFGRTRNDILQDTYQTKKFSVSALYRPGVHTSITGYTYYDENRRTIADDQKRLTLGVKVLLRLAEQTDLQLHYQNNHSPEEYYLDRNVFEVRLNQVLWKKHNFTLRARHTLLRNTMADDETAVMVEYSVPIGVPVARKKSIGTVRGTVYNSKTYEAMDDIILRLNGTAAVTDHRGSFLFPPLKPGKYFLNVDRAGLRLEHVTAQKTPMEIDVEAGDDLNIDLGITHSAVLRGNVSVFRILDTHRKNNILNPEKQPDDGLFIFGRGGDQSGKPPKGPSVKNEGPGDPTISGNPAYAVVNGLGSVLVELSRDDETQRRITDPFGQFVFTDIRPGTWTCRIVEENLPRYHKVENNGFEVTLEPGESKVVTVRVLPLKRRIRVVESGGNLTSQTMKKTDNPKDRSEKMAQTQDTNTKQYELYIVRSGDTLSKIASLRYGDMNAYDRIFQANRQTIADPNFLLPGWKLNIPE